MRHWHKSNDGENKYEMRIIKCERGVLASGSLTLSPCTKHSYVSCFIVIYSLCA